jgi:hypothetical protein
MQMIEKSKLALVALITTVAIGSPALAQGSHHARQNHDQAPIGETWGGPEGGGVNSDDPALTGGGSLGGNELMDHDFE